MLPGGYLCKKWNLKYGDNKEMRNTATDLTEGTPWKIIMRFSIPLFFTFLLQQFYNMVDTIVVGQFLGKDALAGVGSTGAINFMIIGFCMGLANGFVIPVAHFFVLGKFVHAPGFGCYLFLFAIMLLCFQQPLFRIIFLSSRMQRNRKLAAYIFRIR